MKNKLIFIMLSFVFLSVSFAFAGIKGDTVSLEVGFPEPQISRSEYGREYSHIEMPGLSSFGEVGEPVLPVKGLKVLLPVGSKAKDVEIILGEKVTLPGIYLIEPGQKQYPLSKIKELKIVPDQPKPEIYHSTNLYPAKLHKLHSTQEKMGYSIAIIDLSPVEYNPVKGEASYYNNISVAVRFEADKTPKDKTIPHLRIKTEVKEKDQEAIAKLIDNKEDLGVYDQALNSAAQEIIAPLGGAAPLSQYQYVIITDPAFVSNFAPLRERRIQKGLTATIVDTNWIYANYSGTRPDGGTDNATKIRNFVIDAYNNWGTRYVLLAGDGDGASVGGESGNNIIPARGLSDATYPAYQDNNIPADLYYGCLNGSFDYNRNGIYGEITDGVNGGEVDLLAEVYIGRAPVDSATEADNFVRKTLAYEDSTDNNYLGNAYMLGEYLGFGGPAQYATDSMEEVRLGSSANGYTTQGFLSNINIALDANTLYDATTFTWSVDQLKGIINNGVNVLNHLGHANNTHNMKLTNADVDTLTNTKYFIGYSQGCYPASFDNRNSTNTYITSDCIAEHFTTNPTGAVAFIGNSRYGWGEQNSTNGSSQFYDRQSWDALFNEGISQLGRMNQDSKEDNIPYLYYSMNRWCYFEVNLLGDPGLAVRIPIIPIVKMANYSFTEAVGDGDGLFEAGETHELTVTLQALNQDGVNVSATLSTVNPYVTIDRYSSSFGIILKGQTKNNITSPFRFTIASNCPQQQKINFVLTVAANSYSKDNTLTIVTEDFTKPITTNLLAQITPAISGDKIVWQDSRNGNADIYLYDLSTNTERQITTNLYWQAMPAISGNKIVWRDERNSGTLFTDVYLYDLATNSERRITSNSLSFLYYPDISGNRIVWHDERNGDKDIFLYDLTTNSERQITAGSATQGCAAISGNYIVWQDSRNGNADIYLYDLSTNTERQITNHPAGQLYPAISGNYIVWQDSRNGNYQIYLYDLTTNSERRISNNSANAANPAISNNRIVWDDDRNGNRDIFHYDLTTNSEQQITADTADQVSPAISGNRIVWEDYRNSSTSADIYLYTIPVPDTTLPTTPVVIDEGQTTSNTGQLSASWTASDPESGIAEYQYRITQDSTTGSLIRDWTSTGMNSSITATGLSLINGKTYYFSVRAKNGAGLWSGVGYSDGIIVQVSTTIVAPTNLNAKASGRTVTLTWTDNSDNEEGFYIERGSKSGKQIVYQRIAQVGANITTYSETLASSGTYYYRVQAFNLSTGKVSSYSNIVTVQVRVR